MKEPNQLQIFSCTPGNFYVPLCVHTTSFGYLWITRFTHHMPFAIPMVWREPKHHSSDCYFCVTAQQGSPLKLSTLGNTLIYYLQSRIMRGCIYQSLHKVWRLVNSLQKVNQVVMMMAQMQSRKRKTLTRSKHFKLSALQMSYICWHKATWIIFFVVWTCVRSWLTWTFFRFKIEVLESSPPCY